MKCETESSPLTCLTDIKKQALERARSAGNAFSADEAELSASVLSVVEFLMLREQLTSSTSPPVLEPIDCDNPSPSSASSSGDRLSFHKKNPEISAEKETVLLDVEVAFKLISDTFFFKILPYSSTSDTGIRIRYL